MQITHLAVPFLGMSARPFALEMPCMGIACVDPGEYSPMHKHVSCEVHYVRKGELDLRVGRQTVGVHEGTVFFVNAGVEHEQRFVRPSEVYYFPLLVSQYRATGQAGRQSDSSPVSRLLASSWAMAQSTEEMRHCLERIRRAAGSAGEQEGTSPLDRYFAGFVYAFAQAVRHNPVEESPDQDARLAHVDARARAGLLQTLRLIERNYAQSLSVSSLAREACMSVRNFQRLFRRAIGVTPQAYLMETRLRRALVLLRESDVKIDGVMTACGFGSREHFYRFFARRVGASPESYRRNSTRPVRLFD